MTARRWVGGTSLPTENIRRHASWPNGIMTVGPGRVEMRDRLASVRTKKPIELTADPSQVVKAFPIRTRRFGFRGVGITTSEGRDYYFDTRNGKAILAALTAAGFAVTTEVQNPQKLKLSIP
jgi:hypothetical protein